MGSQSVFDYNSFLDFLVDVTESRGSRGGMKSELAEAMGSHPGYLSKVLGEKAQLSFEQAEKIASHLQLQPDEVRYLLFLLHEERAGTASLKKIFKTEREAIRSSRLEIKGRIPQSKVISIEDQATYYSAWYYQAIHVLISIPRFKDIGSVAEHLKLSATVVRDVLIFLEKTGIVARKDNRWVAGERHLHLDRESKLLRQHHTNWRMKSINTLDNNSKKDVRYSSVFSLSEEDAESIRELLLTHLSQYLDLVKRSPEERMYSLNFDFLEV